MLQDWELLLHLGDPKVVQTVAEKHPALLNAVNHVLTTASGGMDLSQSSSRRTQSGWLARSLGADMEDDSMEGTAHQATGGQQQASGSALATGSAITPAQLAAALNFAQNSLRRKLNATSLLFRLIRYFPARFSQLHFDTV